MKKTTALTGFSLAVAAALAACGGGGGGNDSPDAGGNGAATPPTSVQAAAICSGTARTSTTYDVFLPTAGGIAQSSASRYAQLYGPASDGAQCISVAGSTAQADSSPGTLQVVTADNWDDAISYFDPIGTPAIGGVRFDQGLFLTCAGGSDAVKHLGISNPGGSASTLVGADQLGAVVKNTALLSYECLQDGSRNTSAGRGVTTVSFSSDGSVVISDGANGTTTISAADAPSLFTPAGYDKNGNVFRWYLYRLPAGTGTKQVIVHTSRKSDGSFGLIAFLQP